MKYPNFFVAGAPRCGTTSLYTYLSEHPGIFLPKIKELHYFASDFPDLHKIIFKSLDEYVNFFAKGSDGYLAVGEVSPLYIYSAVALSKIKEFNPLAKIILILRKPVDFVQSMHQLNLGLLREDEQDLSVAWDLQEFRKEGKMIPKNCREPQLLLYGELGLFGKHVERVLSIFPKEQVLVVLFDDLVASPKSVYEEILHFLGIDLDGRKGFPTINANYQHRSKLLAQVMHPSQRTYRLFMKTVSVFGVDFMETLDVIYNRVEMLNARRTLRPPLDSVLSEKLQSYFRDDIQKLAKTIGRDLSAWLVNDNTDLK